MKTRKRIMRALTSQAALSIGSPALNRAFLLLFAALAVVASSPSFAHQQKTAVTRLLFNSNTGSLEIMHRLFLHDAEHAANVVFGAKQDIIQSADSRALFGSYVVNRFAVAFDDNASLQELAPIYLGEEIDGQYLWVYQEVPDFATRHIGKALQLRVINSVLRDVWPDQSNLVNVERGGKIESITFSVGADSLQIEVP
jgi:hypothetical protein